jgi:hypothetical protein
MLVLVWVGTFSGVAPLLFSTLARFEGSHNVEIRGGGEVVSVALTHGAANAGRVHEQIHHHCLLARVLTSVADSDGGVPDHVVKFTTGTNVAPEKHLTLPELPVMADTAMPVLVVIEEIALPRLVVALSWPHTAPPECISRPGLVGLSSTLLLI